ncbi:PD40 domain-containing protein [Cytophaga sp. FL35]|uniref:TolB family protein n=1 Tax=Cytophaga sp. FL35 TaxID=1904456 RepID=UPI0016537C4B|nr:PD40 domain-containing protein [Cytophaga sp. FL35]MBC6997642.1 PD40 domain-containing protein [Cytophaga sp. FL35]
MLSFKRLYGLLCMLFCGACILNDDDHFLIGIFPDIPENLVEFNSSFDDYNSTAPTLGDTFPLCFTTNRNSGGANYNVIYKLLSIEFSKRDGTLRLFNNTHGHLDVVEDYKNIHSGLRNINTMYNELGPNLIPIGEVESIENNNLRSSYKGHVLLYSSDMNGSQDIMFTHNLSSEYYSSPQNVSFLNSDHDDAYATFDAEKSKLYFTSNRNGVFNIYENTVDTTKDILRTLSDTDSSTTINATLSSKGDDKCPFILGSMLVFASNREGGFGGYDLYYSTYENGNWSSPVNFGGDINTEFDEFRPIIRKQDDFSNDLMIFSSNRPEGLGGFDLYYVGIDKL